MSEAEDVRILREIAERKEKEQKMVGTIVLVAIVVVVICWIYASNNIEAEKKWCRDASDKEFVAQFESRCAQYRSDPAIKFKIERILESEKK